MVTVAYIRIGACGYRLVVGWRLAMAQTGVRFSLPALGTRVQESPERGFLVPRDDVRESFAYALTRNERRRRPPKGVFLYRETTCGKEYKEVLESFLIPAQ